MDRPNGLVLYNGPSQLSKGKIVAIATGLTRPSANTKTGWLTVQTWMLADNGRSPMSNVFTGKDRSICGDCPHRRRSCYVNVAKAPGQVYRAYLERKYPKFVRDKHLKLFEGRHIRFGSYGDPAAVPIGVWAPLLQVAGSWTGYSHAHATCDPLYKTFLMASVDSPEEREDAKRRGWRCFRIRAEFEPLLEGEFVCPASKEGGFRRTCSECKACHGAGHSGKGADPVIIAHGLPFKVRNFELSRRIALETV